MKNFIKLAAALTASVVSLLSVSSCSNNQQWDPVSVPVDYYTVGYYGVGPASRSLIYKNNEVMYDLSGGYTLTCVEYAGKNLYAGGTFFDGTTSKAVILKDGIVSSGSLAGVCDEIVDMISDGVNIYSCGTVVKSGKTYGVVLKGDSAVYTSLDPCTFKAIDLGASGNIYVATQSDKELGLLRLNNEDYSVKYYETIVAQKTDVRFVANDLFVGNRDISIAIDAFSSAEGASSCSAFCWLSGDFFPLSTNVSSAMCTTFFNGCLITGGSYGDKAVQWCNYRCEDYSYGCNPNSSVRSVFNSGCYLHQAIQSDGQIQLCCNGALAYEIKCPDAFETTDMVIIKR